MSNYVQYGCGQTAPDDWLNFDASPRLWLERAPLIGPILHGLGKSNFPSNICVGDIVSGLPVPDGSVAGLYSSHVLEHIERSQVELALQNSLKLLRPGGIFRLIVPDLESLAARLLLDIKNRVPFAADRFMRDCYLGEEFRPRGIGGWARAVLGNSQHRWMYDRAQLTRMLDDNGFVGIRDCSFGDCEDLRFLEVEHADRFVSDGLTAIAIEARAP